MSHWKGWGTSCAGVAVLVSNSSSTDGDGDGAAAWEHPGAWASLESALTAPPPPTAAWRCARAALRSRWAPLVEPRCCTETG